ncbi:hypothetical protein ACJJI4_23820 (plasmid) [Microbulbifer sp. TRSA002]|uniref:hypothetical protein n=1 Tax=Microbulbifer sp. TRSA002 TaxID=3243382 RepID=UPI004039091A
MTDFSGIDVTNTLSIPSTSLFFREIQHFVNNHSGVIDRVYWYRMESSLPRLRIDKATEPVLLNMIRNNMVKSVAPYIEQALELDAGYLEFIPGKEIRSFSVADVKPLEVSEAEISCLLSLSVPDIQTISYNMDGKAIRLPRLLCDSRSVINTLESNKLFSFWHLYHYACSINAAYLEVSPFCPPKCR